MLFIYFAQFLALDCTHLQLCSESDTCRYIDYSRRSSTTWDIFDKMTLKLIIRIVFLFFLAKI